MKSFFDTMLYNRKMNRHDGRPLWKYDLSEDEYGKLKKHLSEISDNNFDSRDVALYFAEWWKNEYAGSKPSIELVYTSVTGIQMYQNYFYDAAKKGMRELGIPCIKCQNRLFFRTLLLQGGMPLKNMIQNSDKYYRFLLSVLEMEPGSIEDLYRSDIINLLPLSSRNDAVYESCLQIVRAYLVNDREYQEIFERNDAFKEISEGLKKEKEKRKGKPEKRTAFRSYWVLSTGEKNIRLEFNFPDIIENNRFKELVNVNNELKAEYHLIVNDNFICKFRKNLNGDYKICWIENSGIYWDGEETSPEIYLSSANGRVCDFSMQLNSPDISRPSLWSHIGDDEWMLVRGRNCRHERGAVLFGNEWKPGNEKTAEKIRICGHDLNWYVFGENENNAAFESNEGEKAVFTAKALSFEWEIYNTAKPDWLCKSNMPVVTGLPKIVVYEMNGNKPINADFSWRLYGTPGDASWNNWNDTPLPQGCIEYKIELNGCVEKDFFFNLGRLSFSTTGAQTDNATIKILNKDSLNVDYSPSEFYSHNNLQENSVHFFLKDRKRMPGTIKARIFRKDQKKGLLAELMPPFSGIVILDPEGIKLPDKSILLLKNLAGYRIYTPLSNNGQYRIKFYNSVRGHITVREKILGRITPLREYTEIAKRLIRLEDAMNRESTVTAELWEGIRSSPERMNVSYIIRSYSHTLEYNATTKVITVSGDGPVPDLYAFPLDCPHEQIRLYPLVKSGEEGLFRFPDHLEENSVLKKYIVISVPGDGNSSLLPGYVSLAGGEDNADRTTRIKEFSDELENIGVQSGIWMKALAYFDICVKNEVPFSILDIFRAATGSPELAAKLFCFMRVYYEDSDFIDKAYGEKIEEDLGICFHWISRGCWLKAIDWIMHCFDSTMDPAEISEVFRKLSESIRKQLIGSGPETESAGIADYLMQGTVLVMSHFVPRQEFNRARYTLGGRIINELPQITPQIDERYNNILDINIDDDYSRILVMAPLSVALSVTGLDERIWNSGGEEVRRNIQFCQKIAPEWYGRAVLYSIYRLQQTGRLQ